jgi:hypothetical protein
MVASDSKQAHQGHVAAMEAERLSSLVKLEGGSLRCRKAWTATVFIKVLLELELELTVMEPLLLEPVEPTLAISSC